MGTRKRDTNVKQPSKRARHDAKGPHARQYRGVWRRSYVSVLIGLAVVVAAVVVLVSYDGAAMWAVTVDQLVAGNGATTSKVRVQGVLVKGTLVKRDSPCEYRFDLRGDSARVTVRYPQCMIPNTLQDRPEAEVSVTAEGKLSRDGTFVATRVLAKCPSKYEQREGNMVPVGDFTYQSTMPASGLVQ